MTASGSTVLPLTALKTGGNSLSRTFIFYTFGLFVVLGFVFVGILTKITWDEYQSRALRDAETFFQATKTPFEHAIWTVNEEATMQLIRGLQSLEVVERVWVETPDTGTFGTPMYGERRAQALSYALSSPSGILQRDSIGEVFISIDKKAISFGILSNVAMIVVIICAYVLALALVIRSVFARLIGLPLSKIVRYLATPDLIENPPKSELFPDRDDEIGVLAEHLQQMVQRRHKDLKQIQEYQTNLEKLVSQRTKQLQLTQEELMQADNLAALGALVAGVSHELNTPLGNTLMAATTILDAAEKTTAELDRNTLSKERLVEELARIEGTATIILKTIRRARDLVGNFRQVAVDRQSERQRSFDFDHIVRETLATLQPSLNHTRFKIELDLRANTTIDSYPGAVSQLVSNLLENAIKHGYENRVEGTVKFSSSLVTRDTTQGYGKSDYLIFACKDYGMGISEKNLKRVFEPFFTTKFGDGGSGLGMAICYQLTTEVLGGSISISSIPGSETEVTIEIPLNAQAEKAVDEPRQQAV